MVLVRADLCGGVAGGGRRIGVAAIVLVGLFAGTLPTSASAFTVTSAGPTVTVSSGDAADDVAVSDGPGGSVVVEVSGQVPSGTTASCTWDEDRAQLVCPAGTPVQAELEAGDDALSVTGAATVIGIGGAGNDVIDGAFESHGGDGADQLVMGLASGRGRAFGDDGDDAVDVSGTSERAVDVTVDGGADATCSTHPRRRPPASRFWAGQTMTSCERR